MQTLKNHVTLIGNMGSAAHITNFENGNKVARFNLATDSSVKQAQDKKAEWHRVFAWGSMANFIEEYGGKGRHLAIHGRLVKRTYMNKKGEERKVTEIELKHVIGL